MTYTDLSILKATDWSGWTRLPTLPEGVPEIDVDPISLSGVREVGHIRGYVARWRTMSLLLATCCVL